MPKTLKTLLAKLKTRRKSQSASHSLRCGVQEERSGKYDQRIVDGMASLSVTDTPVCAASLETEQSNMVAFGSSHKYDFTFTPEAVSCWPGPEYDTTSMFAPGVFDKARPTRSKAKQKPSKRKMSTEVEQLTLRPKATSKVKVVPEASQRKAPRPKHYYGSPPPRDPPNNLLNFPGEIRNQIYRLLCVSNEPIVAQFRPIIKLKSGTGIGAMPFETIKRFPRLPTLAVVCRQFREEVLSTFYSENTFVFRRSEDERFKDLIMTNGQMMKKWAPYGDLADAPKRIEVHFTIYTNGTAKDRIIYTFRKVADGRVRISNNAHTVVSNSCTCFDQSTLVALKQSIKEIGASKSLLMEAAKLPAFRADRLVNDKSMYFNDFTQCHRPIKPICDECGLVTLKRLESGLGHVDFIG